MISDRITVSSNTSQTFDKMQISLDIRNSTYEDSLSYFLLQNRVLKNCEELDSGQIEITGFVMEDTADIYMRGTPFKVIGSKNLHY